MFDGILNWLGGGNGVAINYRFAQTARTERNRQNHRYPEAPFPFAWPTMTDPYTGKVAGRGVQCALTNTCPKVLETNSANEYWVKTGSLLHSTPLGSDLPLDPANARFYLLSGVEHTVGGSPPTPGTCAQIRNTTDPNPALRALFVVLEQWVEQGIAPPRSEVPGPGTRVYSSAVGNGVGVVAQVAAHRVGCLQHVVGADPLGRRAEQMIGEQRRGRRLRRRRGPADAGREQDGEEERQGTHGSSLRAAALPPPDRIMAKVSPCLAANERKKTSTAVLVPWTSVNSVASIDVSETFRS